MVNSSQPPIDFTEADLADTLERLASGRTLSACPLVHAHFITRYIFDTGIPPSASAREWALSVVLTEIVQDRLDALRDAATRSSSFEGAATPYGFAPKPSRKIARSPDLLGAERECLERDFLDDSPHREAWSCLYYRFIHVPSQHAREIAAIVRPGSTYAGRKLVSRRTRLGFHLLAAALLDRERVALRRAPVEGPGSTVPALPWPVTTAPGAAPAPPEAVPAPAESPPRWHDAHTALDQLRADVLAGTLPLDLPRDQARLLAGHAPADLAEYRLTRIAAWCRPRYALDKRFVALSMLVDLGEEAPGGRWSLQERRYDDLADVLADVPDPALVLLGAPGSGKSTLLRRLELDLAAGAIRDGADGRNRRSAEAGAAGRDQPGVQVGAAVHGRQDARAGVADPVTFFVDLGRHASGPGGDPPEPLTWLNDSWRMRYPGLPALDALLARGGVILLLDALNEMPHADPADYRRRIGAWRAAVIHLTRTHPGTRVIFSCRSLDYSAPLSSPELRVPQVQVEPLDDARIRAFLDAYSPDHADRLWEGLAGTVQIDLFRAPYFLKLLVEEAAASGDVPEGRAALFTRMVHGALKREVERVNPLFDPGPLIAERDYWRVVQSRAWASPYELPERGALFGALANLAYGMQQAGLHGEGAQVRLHYDDACERLSQPHAPDILRAGEALGLLDDDARADEVRFAHQLAQEYFAARRLAAAPEPALLRAPWRAIEVEPGLRRLINTLPLGETLPPLPQTGWEETAVLAAAMAEDAEAFVRGLMAENLVVAGRCANLPELRARLSETLLGELRWALVARSRDPEADLRARIAAALELGGLGDPRFERRVGPFGEYLMPPLVEISGGVYPIGEDEPIYMPNDAAFSHLHMPRHAVAIAPFRIGQFALTNAEWACFMAAGGYDDTRWWDTAGARAWQQGEGTVEGMREMGRTWWRLFRERPEFYGEMRDAGRFASEDATERWGRWPALPEAEFEAEMRALWPEARITEPSYWRHSSVNHPSQPVAGVCWFEVRAYCNWLSAQTGLRVRMPTEVEWEAAARGREGRRYAFGDDFDALWCNVLPSRLHRSAPVGVFAEGDTPEGVCDLTGNVFEVISSAVSDLDLAPDGLRPVYAYPYDPHDGREDPDPGPQIARAARGGSWNNDPSYARSASRGGSHPATRGIDSCGRVVVDVEPP